MEREGWTQSVLAKELGITQGYLSRFLKGENRPRKALRDRIAMLTDHIARGPADDFADRVRRAASASTEFKVLVEAALQLMENTNNNE